MTELTSVPAIKTLERKSVRMRKARVNAGLTQREAAEKMGVGQSRVSNYENEINKDVPAEFLKQCAKAYNCALEYLYGFTDELNGEYAYRPITPSSPIALGKHLLSEQGLSITDLSEITVTDDAMNNEFTKNTVVIVNKKVGVINQPAIYAIDTGSQIVMRGIRKELNNQYTLFVHNKQSYDDQTLSENELSSLNIVGKYIGHWRYASN